MIEKLIDIHCVTQWLNTNISESAIIALIAVIVALLIPIVFFIMDKNDFYSFDKNVVLDKILLYRCLIPLVIIISFLLLFKYLIILTLLASIGLIIISAIVLVRSYKWLRSYDEAKYKLTYRQAKRIEYLQNIKSKEELKEVWNLIFYDEKFLEKNQTGFIETFLKSIQNYEDNFLNSKILDDNRNFISDLLSMLCDNFDKINFSDIRVFTKLTGYSLLYFTIELNKRIYLYAQRTIFEKLFIYSLRRESFFYYKFFEHVDKFAQNKSIEFYKDLFTNIFDILKKNKNDKYNDLWEVSFLKNNTITEQSLSGDKLKIINTIFESYMHFINNELTSNNPDKVSIEGITENLFPNVDMIDWFELLTFEKNDIFFDNINEPFAYARIRNWATLKRNFGHSSHNYNGYGTKEENYQRVRRETIFFLKKAIYWLNDNYKIQEYIDMIEQIKKEKLFDRKSNEYLRIDGLQYLLRIFLESNNSNKDE